MNPIEHVKKLNARCAELENEISRQKKTIRELREDLEFEKCRMDQVPVGKLLSERAAAQEAVDKLNEQRDEEKLRWQRKERRNTKIWVGQIVDLTTQNAGLRQKLKEACEELEAMRIYDICSPTNLPLSPADVLLAENTSLQEILLQRDEEIGKLKRRLADAGKFPE
jgi:hypothetical protein